MSPCRLMQPAVLTSMLFAFTLSLDEFQRSLLITGNRADPAGDGHGLGDHAE